MAEHGLRTYPLAIDEEETIKLIEAEFGLKGFALTIKLIQYICSKGYFSKWDIDIKFLFMRDRHIEAGDGGLVSEVVERCIRRELFNAGLFEKYGVLTNSDIQETYLKTNARKQEISFIKEYALPVVYRFIENASKNKQNVNILFKNVSNSSATILDDIKLDDIIVDEGIGTYGLHDNVKMHSEVFDKLGVLLTGKIRDDYINRLSGWIKTKAPNFSGDPAATIQKWVNKDLADGKLTVPNSKGKSYTSEQLNILFNKLSYEDL